MNTATIDARILNAQNLRLALLEVHRELIEHERRLYEKDHGRQSAADFLQLLTNDAAFRWLEVLSGLIVAFDEALEAEDAAQALPQLVAQARSLLRREPDATEPFSLRYTPVLDVSPDVALAHMKAIAALRHV
jgi:hypothetical protein